jgi:hypothetical protein
MPDRKGPRETGTSEVSHTASNREQAEESRGNTNIESGLTNRPIAEEQADQQNVPPRGSNK